MQQAPQNVGYADHADRAACRIRRRIPYLVRECQIACMATATLPKATDTHDVFPINGTDYVEFHVGNAKQAAHYYQTAFGFQLAGYRGPETGVRDRVSYLLTQNKIRLVLTSALGPDGPIAEHVNKHGDGVRDIALWVDDARDAYRKAVDRGARGVQEPTVLRDDKGE